MTALTPSLRAMLERIAKRGPLLELSITSSGGREGTKLNALLRAGLAQRIDHPTVKDRRSGYPADAIEITEAGRNAMEPAP